MNGQTASVFRAPYFLDSAPAEKEHYTRYATLYDSWFRLYVERTKRRLSQKEGDQISSYAAAIAGLCKSRIFESEILAKIEENVHKKHDPGSVVKVTKQWC